MRRLHLLLVCGLLAVAAAPQSAAQGGAGRAQPDNPPAESTDAGQGEAARTEAARRICKIVQSEAEARRIPAGFFARLIWKESHFNPDAVSPKGAQGIAQFMPGTAAERALADPFDIPTSLAASAAFLRELADAFGNLGLAAAAYNAGPRRVEAWVAGRASLPWETLDFVLSITGLSAEAWTEEQVESPDFTIDEALSFEEGCVRLAMAGRPRLPEAEPPANWRPWGVQVAAHFSRNVALAAYSRAKSRHASLIGEEPPMVVRDRAPARGRASLFAVRVGADTQEEAREICSALRAAGGACLVKKN